MAGLSLSSVSKTVALARGSRPSFRKSFLPGVKAFAVGFAEPVFEVVDDRRLVLGILRDPNQIALEIM